MSDTRLQNDLHQFRALVQRSRQAQKARMDGLEERLEKVELLLETLLNKGAKK